MMAQLLVLIPLLPLLAAVLLALLQLAGRMNGDGAEKVTAAIAVSAMALSSLAASTVLIAGWLHPERLEVHHYGNWLAIGNWQIAFQLGGGLFNLSLAALFALLLLIVMRFSVNYMHREAGFHRLFALLSLLAAAMLLLVLSANAVFTFIGWEFAGLCSYSLIAYAYERPTAAHNATRVFITNRIGDGGFLLAIALAMVWLESSDWQVINQHASDLDKVDVTILALCLALAALVKSVQLPFTPWLLRAMEGPTPSSAVFYGGVMIHAGVFLLIQNQLLLQQAPLVMTLLTVSGALTALYSYWSGLSQTDIKTAQAFATSGQLGLMFISCGLGYWQLASWHLAAHAVVRCYLLLTAPSVMHNTAAQPVRPVALWLSRCRWGFLLSLQRGWLEETMDWIWVRPLSRIAKDMLSIEHKLVAPLLAAPAPLIRRIASIAEQEEQKIGARLHNDSDVFAQGSGLAGKLTQWAAAVSQRFEYQFILYGIGRDSIRFGRKLGHAANRIEQLLLQPRYITLFVLISLLIVLGS